MEEQSNSILNDNKKYLINYAIEHHWANFIIKDIRECENKQKIDEVVKKINDGEDMYEARVMYYFDN